MQMDCSGTCRRDIDDFTAQGQKSHHSMCAKREAECSPNPWHSIKGASGSLRVMTSRISSGSALSHTISERRFREEVQSWNSSKRPVQQLDYHAIRPLNNGDSQLRGKIHWLHCEYNPCAFQVITIGIKIMADLEAEMIDSKL
jgi:hypothetical protein